MERQRQCGHSRAPTEWAASRASTLARLGVTSPCSASNRTWYGTVGSSAVQLGSLYWRATTLPRSPPSLPAKHCTGVPIGKRSGGAFPAAALSCQVVTAFEICSLLAVWPWLALLMLRSGCDSTLGRQRAISRGRRSIVVTSAGFQRREAADARSANLGDPGLFSQHDGQQSDVTPPDV